jgi:HrpA-like RNA helicase
MKNKIKLPVDEFESEIVTTVKKNSVTILVGGTGTGKSTRVPFMLINGLGKPVIVTQPRRLAAEALAMRVAEENNLILGGLVGFRTAVTGNDGPSTFLLYVTDGLQTVRELTEAKKSLKNGVTLIIDEAHELNQNIETLLAYSDQLIKQDVAVRIVIMSATMNHELLSKYFNDAPVIHIPGKTFPVFGEPSSEEDPHQVPEEEIVNEIRKSMALRKNTLVFLPGKKEIFNLAQELSGFSSDVEIIELHGDLRPDEQNRVFGLCEKIKLVLATNVAQTSITIPDIDYVIDSGYEKRIELLNGVETLMRRCISKADVKQRAGRAGRTKEGMYILCNDTPYQQFIDFPIPEIRQKRLDQMVLRLATAGFDATKLRFLHQPDMSILIESKQTLIDMEAMEEDGTVTELGFQINRFPTSIIVARMIIEALKRKCLSKILTFAAILSNTKSSIKQQWQYYRDYPIDFRMWDQVIPAKKPYKSDLLVEFELWDLAFQDLHTLGQNGVDKKNYLDSVTIRKQLKTIVFKIGYHAGSEYNENIDNETEILKCITAGMIHHVYTQEKDNRYIGQETRYLSHDSLIHRGGYPKLIVGTPMNIPIKNKLGGEDIITRIINNCTAIEASWLTEIAPHLIRTEKQTVWSNEKLMLVTQTITFFNNREITCADIPTEWSEENVTILADALSQTYLSAGDLTVGWIYELRAQFAKDKLGTNVHFAKEFEKAISGYNTLLVSELKVYAKNIRKIVFNEKPSGFPEVRTSQFINALNSLAQKKKETSVLPFKRKRRKDVPIFYPQVFLVSMDKYLKQQQLFGHQINP